MRKNENENEKMRMRMRTRKCVIKLSRKLL
eukprot:COSAG01_NODE_75810_length_192_cov_198.731183_1_plen_29_part_01